MTPRSGTNWGASSTSAASSWRASAKRLVEMHQMLTTEEAMTLLAAVVDTIRRHVVDRGRWRRSVQTLRDSLLTQLAARLSKEAEAEAEPGSGCAAGAWTPFPGPQTDAFKSRRRHRLLRRRSWAAGRPTWSSAVALTAHQLSIIYRREYPQLKGIVVVSRNCLAQGAVTTPRRKCGACPPAGSWSSARSVPPRPGEVPRATARPQGV